MEDNIKIVIRQINYATIKVISEQDVALEISEGFKFLVPGYKFMPGFKNGSFDGYINLFNLGSRTMGAGLLGRLQKFLDDRDYEYTVDTMDCEDKLNLDDSNVLEYMESLNLHARGEPLVIRNYQVLGVKTALNERTCILNATTGSGKSMILYSISRYITETLGGRVLVIVPTVGLTTQLKSDFKDYSSHNGYDVESNFHMISGGIDKNVNKKIVVSTFQSLKDIPAAWLNSFMAIIADEGHKITAGSFKAIYDKASKVPYRLACTGTVHDTKCNLLQMESITGPVFEIATAKDLIAAKQLVPLKVKGISLNYPKDICKQFTKVEYEDEIKWVTTNPKRNNFLTKLAISCKGTTLVLFRFVEHGKLLYNKIKEAVGDTREVYYVDGEVGKDDREKFRLASSMSDAILVFSYATSSAGINMPALENIIIAHPIKSRITYLQSIGRGLRLKEGKEFCTLYDIGDNLSHKSKVNTTYSHFGHRLETLAKEGYEFTITNVEF